MATSYRFALTGTGQQFVACAELLLAHGHQIVGVLSDCPEVTAWAERRGVQRTPHDTPGSRWLDGTPFDYLVSIVNHAVLPADLLAAPAKFAINYHDSPLPEYGGFNATAWAIIDGRTSHGVTWHRMTMDVDGGDVLLQRAVDISDDDTAFTLGVKCSEAGIDAFGALLAQIEKDAIVPRPQQGRPSFHLRSERPGLALLDFARPAKELHAFVRGLNFGTDDNWMSKPKLLAPGGILAVTDSRAEPSRPAQPGTVLAITTRGIGIATSSGALWVSELSTMDGASIDWVQAATRFGIVEGQRLPSVDPALVSSAAAFDAVVTKSERFWVKRLSNLRPAALADLKPHAAVKRPRTLDRSMPAALATAPVERRNSVLVAALSAYVSRLGGGDTFDLASRVALADSLTPFYAAAIPLRCTVAQEERFSALIERTRDELATITKRGTYARDALGRYKALRGVTPDTLSIPIGVSCVDGVADQAVLCEGIHLALVSGSGARYAWVYDEAALPHQVATMLADRFDELLASCVQSADVPVSALSLLPRAEVELLLDTWQQTAKPYESTLCVHQHFERQVERTPDATAVVFDGIELTYRELNKRANQLAHTLRAAGVGPETLVGLCVQRSLDMIVSLLGILKAGGAYVPLDPAYPADRLAIMLEDSKAGILVTQSHLVSRLPATNARLVFIDQLEAPADDAGNPASGVTAENLAYVIFTSGSTGRPKGIMVEHRNVSNFFTGMDGAVGGSKPGVWLAVTSISFDISVLELFWTLARGFEVVIAPEADRASLARRDQSQEPRAPAASKKPMGFGIFYFAADSGTAEPGNAYRLLIEGAKFADEENFEAVWTPERHFHAFGGLYPNPSVTTAALATITKRVKLRAGSVVLPLHNPLRVAEEWAVIDQLSNGRVGLSFASGWHVNDFAFMPENFERRRELMYEQIETVKKLWRGETVPVKNGAGEIVEVSVLPRPVQRNPPLWIAAAGSPQTFIQAGKIGANILTNMLGQDLNDLKKKFEAYRTARREAGHESEGIISVMLHTFVCGSTEEARRYARKPFSDYLATSFDLVKVAPQMFPAFKQPSRASAVDAHLDSSGFTDEDMAALLDHAFDRYFDMAGLFGTPERALEVVDQLTAIGATEVACLIDFGIDPDVVLANLPHLARLRDLCRDRAAAPAGSSDAQLAIAEQIRSHGVTHLQCTPSMARMLTSDPEALPSLARLDKLLLGGEALPADLAEQMAGVVSGSVLNMYGPTETAVWSTTSTVSRGAAPTIGRPIANTTIRILDDRGQLVPIGAPGELWISGSGVARGYFGRPDLTGERFLPDPWTPGARMYRTGDLARYRSDGEIEFLGRLDHQVKVNGYRIELGEIETVLTRHRSVREGVVVARTSGDGVPQLVAYVVPAVATGSDNDADRVRAWQGVWEEAYKRPSDDNGAESVRSHIAGWNDSYTGEPIVADQMREWLEATVKRILAIGPKRVLEIGCGNGMILYRVLPHVNHYAGVDISKAALDSIQRELAPDESAKVTLQQAAADAIEGIPPRSLDLVVINSVLQYFPNVDYLRRVVRRATELVADGGHIFIGDVRSLAHLGAFRASVELHHAPAEMRGAEVRERIDWAIAHESELTLSESFFDALVRDNPRLARADVELKRGPSMNELTRFRYDVVLHVGPKIESRGSSLAPVHVETLDEIRSQLSREPAALYLTDVPNARLTDIASAERALRESPSIDASQLRAALQAARDSGVDPEAIYTLNDAYDVQLRWARSGDPNRLDALLRHKSRGMAERWPVEAPVGAANTTHANQPTQASDAGAITTQLRTHLRQSLPEYMVPTTFMVLDKFPLTPNGKIDRKALPEPERRGRQASAAYAPPSNNLEQQIAEIWQEMLGAERVGRRDNIFDLGANSLLTMQANNRLSALLGRKVSLVSMFRYPTVESLAAHLGDAARPSEHVNDKRAQDRASRSDKAAERRRALRAERNDR